MKPPLFDYKHIEFVSIGNKINFGSEIFAAQVSHKT
jgi:hypothetical protein